MAKTIRRKKTFRKRNTISNRKKTSKRKKTQKWFLRGGNENLEEIVNQSNSFRSLDNLRSKLNNTKNLEIDNEFINNLMKY
jgi:hypothetical protein